MQTRRTRADALSRPPPLPRRGKEGVVVRNTAAWGLWCVALVGVLVSQPRAQAPSGALTTLPAHGQVSLIASAAGNSVEIGRAHV